MNINGLVANVINEFFNESIDDYSKWKRANVTLRGIKESGNDNGVYGSFGKGLYTVPLSNKAMAKQYGEVYFLVNAIPKMPKIVDSLNNAEIWIQTLVNNFCKKNGVGYNLKYFEKHTTIEAEMIKLGYDGLIIKGREMVNYKPENVHYYKTENQLYQYYEFLKGNINESKNLNCIPIKLTKEIIDEVSKFNSSEELLRSGGISIDALDRAAFGFSTNDITTLMPNQLSIKWKDDLENVKYEINLFRKKHNNLSLTAAMKMWANSINLSEPIDVSYEKNKFYIEDGHHRYYAAKILNKPLNINLEIKSNPITKLAPSLSYDDFHRCIFNQVKAIE